TRSLQLEGGGEEGRRRDPRPETEYPALPDDQARDRSPEVTCPAALPLGRVSSADELCRHSFRMARVPRASSSRAAARYSSEGRKDQAAKESPRSLGAPSRGRSCLCFELS